MEPSTTIFGGPCNAGTTIRFPPDDRDGVEPGFQTHDVQETRIDGQNGNHTLVCQVQGVQQVGLDESWRSQTLRNHPQDGHEPKTTKVDAGNAVQPYHIMDQPSRDVGYQLSSIQVPNNETSIPRDLDLQFDPSAFDNSDLAADHLDLSGLDGQDTSTSMNSPINIDEFHAFLESFPIDHGFSTDTSFSGSSIPGPAEISRDGIVVEESSSNNDDDDYQESEGLAQHSHVLRPHVRDVAFQYSTWIDKDKSGNYDPAAKIARSSRRRTKLSIHQSHDKDLRSLAQDNRRLQKTQSRLQEAAIRANGRSLVITFPLSSDKGRSLLAAEHDNWPDDEWNVLREDGLDQIGVTSASELGDHSAPQLPSYKLRSRQPHTRLDTEKPNLLGQPIARGCWSCYELGLLRNEDALDKEKLSGCSLLHDNSVWPCRTCAEDEHVCELIIPPKVKKSCEGCKKRKMNCSYTRTADHRAPCMECQSANHSCIAGPNKSMLRPRLDLDKRVDQVQPRKDVTCTECLKSLRPCSLSRDMSDKINRTCRRCAKSGLICIVADRETLIYPSEKDSAIAPTTKESTKRKAAELNIFTESTDSDVEDTGPPSQRRKKRHGFEEEHVLEHETEAQHQPEVQTRLDVEHDTGHAEASSGPFIAPLGQSISLAMSHEVIPPAQTTIIVTKLCHPVTFNTENKALDPKCHFCSTPSYPVLGLGDRNAQVTTNSLGQIKELSGGHKADGQAATRICTACTYNLVRIVTCLPAHKVKPIIDSSGQQATAQKIRDMLIQLVNEADTVQRLDDKWCSICPAPALYRCCNKSNVGSPKRNHKKCKERQEESNGCGLLLCHTCAKQLDTFQGYLPDMLESLPNRITNKRPFGLRADAELFRNDSELEAFLLALN